MYARLVDDGIEIHREQDGDGPWLPVVDVTPDVGEAERLSGPSYRLSEDEQSVEAVWEIESDGPVTGIGAPTVDPNVVEQVRAQLAKATTVAGVKNALGPLLDALA